MYGNELRAVFENVVLAEYYCRYDIRDRKVKAIRDGRYVSHDDFTSEQYTLIPLNPQESLVVYRQASAPRQARLPFPAEQLWLFELVSSTNPQPIRTHNSQTARTRAYERQFHAPISCEPV